MLRRTKPGAAKGRRSGCRLTIRVGQLLDAVWAGRVVELSAVHRGINHIRRALGDDPRHPRYIETIRKRGYRTIATVAPHSLSSEDHSVAAPRTFAAVHDDGRESRGEGDDPPVAAAQARPRIAVLPFANLSRDPDQQYFSEGISEDILDALGRNSDLTVRARQSSFLFKPGAADPKAIGERLDVSHLVSGSVRTHGSRVRVSARLTDVAANADVWSERYDRELTDIFAVQDEITGAIVGALGLHFSAPAAARRRVDPGAYDAYLSGRHHQMRYALEEAVACFTRATELAPSYPMRTPRWHRSMRHSCGCRHPVWTSLRRRSVSSSPRHSPTIPTSTWHSG